MIIAVDFDGTIVENKFPEIGELKMIDDYNTTLDCLKNLQSKGCEIILWTCRCGKHLEEAVKFCSDRGFEFNAVNDDLEYIKEQYKEGMDWWYKNLTARKVYADIYIDDKAMNNMLDVLKVVEDCK